MRTLVVLTSRGTGSDIEALATEYGCVNTVLVEGHDRGEPVDVQHINVSNAKVQDFMDAFDSMEGVRVTLYPIPVLPLSFPTKQAQKQVIDVELLSPIEILLGGMRSIGSMWSLLIYAVASGVITWFGMFDETVSLLIRACS